ncbi:BolA family protein [Rhodocyclus purpureus]|uniref:BolA family protein n=1 Tax=Rhodocyclus purpureus TaxID=1067 RepID=UPI001913FB4B|nr:BolA family protein [Rhodocyclus purpureus]MBK5915508.1 transcriptional regulator [Rhodocyclus purpureus]
MSASTVEARLRERLAQLAPTQIEIIDESAKHAGHAGSGGGAHFRLLIVSPRFSGLNTLARHRLVTEAVGELMHGEIHALSIKARTPEEV